MNGWLNDRMKNEQMDERWQSGGIDFNEDDNGDTTTNHDDDDGNTTTNHWAWRIGGEGGVDVESEVKAEAEVKEEAKSEVMAVTIKEAEV